MAVGGASEHDLPVRSDDLVLALLGRALAELPPADAEAMAEDVGATYGRALAAGLTGDALDVRTALAALGDAGRRRRAHRPRVRRPHRAGRRRPGGPPPIGSGRLRIVNDHCPFGAVAIDHPVICAVDRGLVRGMLGALYPDGVELAVATESSKAMGDTYCATAV